MAKSERPTHLAENFEHLFPHNDFSELPQLLGIMGIARIPQAMLYRQWMLHQFKVSLSQGEGFLKRTNLNHSDRIQMQIWLNRIMPTRRPAYWIAGSVRGVLSDDESLGGVGTEYVDGLYALTVIGILKAQQPAGLIWFNRGNLMESKQSTNPIHTIRALPVTHR